MLIVCVSTLSLAADAFKRGRSQKHTRQVTREESRGRKLRVSGVNREFFQPHLSVFNAACGRRKRVLPPEHHLMHPLAVEGEFLEGAFQERNARRIARTHS